MNFYTTLLLCLFTLASARWQLGPKETDVESDPGMRKQDKRSMKKYNTVSLRFAFVIQNIANIMVLLFQSQRLQKAYPDVPSRALPVHSPINAPFLFLQYLLTQIVMTQDV